jgi:crotonobetainyl-CoA:carnitine CoA-transferase CaiB-like acyl-CoA transferase
LPLAGVTVVAVEQAIAAPFATRQLADLGARVIKIERVGDGDFARGYDTLVNGLATHFVWTNRSKESLTLDLKQSAGQELLWQLLAQADVFVQNLAPGAMARLGFSAEAIQAHNARCIVCDLSGYGDDGPYRDRKAYDLLIQCEVGLPEVTGTPETPSKTGISTADIAGGMYAFSSILLALYERERTGRGRALRVSLFDALAEWMGFPFYAAYGGATPPRTGASHAAIAPYGPFPTQDGTLFLAVQNEREWRRLCGDVLGTPELPDDPRFGSNHARVQHRQEVDGAIAAALRQLPTEVAEQRLDAAGIAYSRLRPVGDLLTHPQMTARGRWQTVDTAAGPIPALLPAFAHVADEVRFDPVPALSQHTDAILEELGYDADARARLRRDGVVQSS